MPHIRRGYQGLDYAMYAVAAAEANEDRAAAAKDTPEGDEAAAEFCAFVYEATVAELQEYVTANPDAASDVVACEEAGKKRAGVLKLAD